MLFRGEFLGRMNRCWKYVVSPSSWVGNHVKKSSGEMRIRLWRRLLAIACVAMLAACDTIRTWQAASYGNAHHAQISSIIRVFLSKSLVKYYVGIGPVAPIRMKNASALAKNKIFKVERLRKPVSEAWQIDTFALRFSSQGRALERLDKWQSVASKYPTFSLRVGFLRFRSLVSVTPIGPDGSDQKGSAAPKYCYRVSYSARFVLTKEGSDLRRYSSGEDGPFVGVPSLTYPQPMTTIIDSEPRFSDAGKSVIEVANVCDWQKRGWHVVFPPEGSL